MKWSAGCLWLIASMALLRADVVFAQEFEESYEAETVQQTVQQILEHPDYRHLFQEDDTPEPHSDDTLPQWVVDFLEWLFGSNETREIGGASLLGLTSLLFYLALVVLVVVVVVLLVALLRGLNLDRNGPQSPELLDQEAITPSTPPGDVPVNEYEQRAILSARQGDFRSAIRELVLGAMSWTERAERIRYRRGLTNRDYVRALWSDELRRDALLDIVGAFELVFFGRRNADEAMFRSCLHQFRQSFLQESEHATTAN